MLTYTDIFFKSSLYHIPFTHIRKTGVKYNNCLSKATYFSIIRMWNIKLEGGSQII